MSKRTKHVASPHATTQAAALAAKMPLVHFPASARFDDWQGWSGLKSRAVLGRPLDPGPFGLLRGSHIFLYAGPSCYDHHGSFGDAAIYFSPEAEKGHQGSATPFDSGSLEDNPPRLQPFRSKATPPEKCWQFFERHQVALDTWRSRFEGWLAHAYDDPDRYVETLPDRYAAGQPDRLTPASLLQHNGTRGRVKYGSDCGDRRTWTWEVRIHHELPFDHVAALHVPFDSLNHALDSADRLRFRTGAAPNVETLPRDVPGSFQTLYEASSSILRKLMV